MKRTIAGCILALAALALRPAAAQGAPAAAPDPLQALAFLEGTWDARAPGEQGTSTLGSYSFVRELDGHVLARHGITDPGCKGPTCAHRDLLLVYPEGAGQPLKAIYFDNEGHVIHYAVTTPDATTAQFVSDTTQPGPQFRLLYRLQGAVMSGAFQMRMPGQTDWKPYLEWSGRRK
jgi:hypothetical protein